MEEVNRTMKELDIRDISIIDSLPVHGFDESFTRVMLNVGCGEGRIDWHLKNMKYCVFSTDIEKTEGFPDDLDFHKANIFDMSTFPLQQADVVICSQVLEHLKDYKIAVKNLLALAQTRVIITIPYDRSFASPDHVNHWDYDNVYEFHDLCEPYSVAISRIRTKPKDIQLNQWCYLIVVDKRQQEGV